MKEQADISLEAIKQPFWALLEAGVFEALKTSPRGLGAEQARARRDAFGFNRIEEKQRLGAARIFVAQFRNPFILILIAAGILTSALTEWVNTAVIGAAVLVNTFLGFWQEKKAEDALSLLKTYLKTRARVRRESVEREIDSIDLVPGDVIRVSQGDRVPADIRIIFASNCEIDESVLTGESLPVEKMALVLPAATTMVDRSNMGFSGTLVVGGFADGVVTATGSRTEFGHIAHLIAARERTPTPLQQSIQRFSSRAGLVLSGLIFILFLAGIASGYGIFDMFLIAVAAAVSAVPEGLPVALTVILAVGVIRLARRRGIVRRILAAETLGSASLILTDKTGTLTQARMELVAVVPYRSGGDSAQSRLLSDALINTDVVLENPEDDVSLWRMFGKPLEVSFVRGAAQRGVKTGHGLGNAKIIERIPFSSETKFSVTLSGSEASAKLVCLGAPDIVMRYSALSDDERNSLNAEIDRRAYAGERILGVVGKEFSGGYPDTHEMLKLRNLEFRGLLAFRDPIRPGVRDAIRSIARAGVKTVMVTGDHRGTAEAVARELGMVDGKDAVLSGDDLNFLTPEELKSRADGVSVYARVTPLQKMMLVTMYKEKGEVVAVTGDGVNDAPALEVADIGVAVGSGTDVAKSAADLVILDDNFETIVSAIEEGRKILDNIRKVVVYLLSDALDELFLIGGALLLGIAVPLNALQILFVNFFSDSFPAIAFAFEGGVDGLGSRPRRLDRNLFDRQMRFLILIIGTLSSLFLLILYALLLHLGLPADMVRTFIFASFGTYTLFLSFALRSLEKSIFAYNPFSNRYLTAGVFVGLLLTASVIYIPFFAGIFNVVPLPPLWLAGVFVVGILNIGAVEIGKWIFRKNVVS